MGGRERDRKEAPACPVSKCLQQHNAKNSSHPGSALVNCLTSRRHAARASGKVRLMPRPRTAPVFVHQFEGAEVLEALLQASGSRLSAAEALELLREGYSQRRSVGEVISKLFKGEPRFPDPSVAKQLFQNLLGLWDLLQSDRPIALHAPYTPDPKPPPHPAPGSFAPNGPDRKFVENAWRYLEDLDKRGRNRLQHSFENRQDSLLGFLEEQGLSDAGFDCAEQLVFELFSMIELGWPPGTRPVLRSELDQGGQIAEQAPAALLEYADEQLFEAEQDEESPLAPDEAAEVRRIVTGCLRALWAARRIE